MKHESDKKRELGDASLEREFEAGSGSSRGLEGLVYFANECGLVATQGIEMKGSEVAPVIHGPSLVPALLGLTLLALLFAGCNGIPTKPEKEAREQQRKVSRDFRPDGHKPALPELTADSGLSNFLAYAMLNRPNVEAAYFDWLASI